jgi:hypothetical protein
MLEVVEKDEFIRTGASARPHGRDYDRFVPLLEQITTREASPAEMRFLAPDQRGYAESWVRGGRVDRS